MRILPTAKLIKLLYWIKIKCDAMNVPQSNSRIHVFKESNRKEILQLYLNTIIRYEPNQPDLHNSRMHKNITDIIKVGWFFFCIAIMQSIMCCQMASVIHYQSKFLCPTSA